jgi:hypothetical protein
MAARGFMHLSVRAIQPEDKIRDDGEFDHERIMERRNWQSPGQPLRPSG